LSNNGTASGVSGGAASIASASAPGGQRRRGPGRSAGDHCSVRRLRPPARLTPSPRWRVGIPAVPLGRWPHATPRSSTRSTSRNSGITASSGRRR